jgi:hypothetical protein
VSAASAAARGRAFADAQFTSACTVFKPGEPITDPQTGEVTRAPQTIWFGPCRVRPGSGQMANAGEAGGGEVFEFAFVVSVPFSVASVIEGHRLTVTASPDPALIGMTLEVQRIDRGDNVTARRLFCQEVI